MEFLVDITVRLPADLPDDARSALMTEERRVGRDYVENGTIRHIWRVPGALRNVSIWSAEDATELHERLTALPSYPWCEISVMALARHPLSGGPEVG